MLRALASLLIVSFAVPPSIVFAKKPKPKYGMFGTIHGKPFHSVSNGNTKDPCAIGIYRPTLGIFVLAAIECRKSLKRHVPKKNYDIVNLACTHFDPATPITPPYEIPCQASIYTENKTGRFGVPKSQSIWGASATTVEGSPYPSSALMLRIDSFDGTIIHAKLFGTFDTPMTNASGEAAISGEVSIDLPVQVN